MADFYLIVFSFSVFGVIDLIVCSNVSADHAVSKCLVALNGTCVQKNCDVRFSNNC